MTDDRPPICPACGVTMGIVVAHTQGGDRSGNIDEIQRHAISKLAHVHFPETEEAAERLRNCDQLCRILGDELARVAVQACDSALAVVAAETRVGRVLSARDEWPHERRTVAVTSWPRMKP